MDAIDRNTISCFQKENYQRIRNKTLYIVYYYCKNNTILWIRFFYFYSSSFSFLFFYFFFFGSFVFLIWIDIIGLESYDLAIFYYTLLVMSITLTRKSQTAFSKIKTENSFCLYYLWYEWRPKEHNKLYNTTS